MDTYSGPCGTSASTIHRRSVCWSYSGICRGVLAVIMIITVVGCSISEVTSGGDSEPVVAWHTCQRPLGALVVLEEGVSSSLREQGLPQIEPVIGVLARKTNCFNLAKRGQAIYEAALREQEIEGGAGSERVAAKYTLVTTVMLANKTGGSSLIGEIGGIAGQAAQPLANVQGLIGLRADPAFETSAAQVVLSLVNNDTGLEVGAAEGAATARDARLKGGLSALWGQTPTAASGEAYATTPLGRLVSAALMDGFNKLVTDVEPVLAY